MIYFAGALLFWFLFYSFYRKVLGLFWVLFLHYLPPLLFLLVLEVLAAILVAETLSAFLSGLTISSTTEARPCSRFLPIDGRFS